MSSEQGKKYSEKAIMLWAALSIALILIMSGDERACLDYKIVLYHDLKKAYK
jgi:hypothetical protein